MSDTLATIAHGSPAGYDLGCKSAGGCPNHGSAEWLTCKEAAAARRGDFALTKLPLDEPIESVGHFGIDVGILFLFVDNAFVFGAEVDEVGA